VRRERGDLRIISEVGELVNGPVDLTDEQGMKSGSFRASDVSPLRESSDIADLHKGSPIDTSGRAHPLLRSAVGSEGTGSFIAGSMEVEGEGAEMVEVSDANPLRKSSEIAESRAESPVVMFDDRGNSLRKDSKTEGVGGCD
jgi:hypothetical protein